MTKKNYMIQSAATQRMHDLGFYRYLRDMYEKDLDNPRISKRARDRSLRVYISLNSAIADIIYSNNRV